MITHKQLHNFVRAASPVKNIPYNMKVIHSQPFNQRHIGIIFRLLADFYFLNQPVQTQADRGISHLVLMSNLFQRA